MESTEITSILDSVKKKLGLEPEIISEFDPDLIDDINMAISTLTQMGVGPVEGFAIHDNSATWEEFIGADPRLNLAKAYVFAEVKLLFDPPQSSYVLTNMKEKSDELLWRLNIFVECPESFPQT